MFGSNTSQAVGRSGVGEDLDSDDLPARDREA